MENAKLEIVKFDNADVIATSGPVSLLTRLTLSGIYDGTLNNITLSGIDNEGKYLSITASNGSADGQSLVDFINQHFFGQDTEWYYDDTNDIQFQYYDGAGTKHRDRLSGMLNNDENGNMSDYNGEYELGDYFEKVTE